MNMIMKQLNFKIVLLFLTIYVCPHRTLAQKDTLLYRTLIQDSILIPQKSQATIEEEGVSSRKFTSIIVNTINVSTAIAVRGKP